jgi:hypothetical protein
MEVDMKYQSWMVIDESGYQKDDESENAPIPFAIF